MSSVADDADTDPDIDPPGTVGPWRPIDLPTLIQALDLSPAGDQQWQAWGVNPTWSTFAGSQLLGSSTVALERTFPGFEVR